MKIRTTIGLAAVGALALAGLTGCFAVTTGDANATRVTVTAAGECKVNEGALANRIERLSYLVQNDNAAAASVDVIAADGKVVSSINDVAAATASKATTIKDLAAGEYTLGCKVAGKSDYVGKSTIKVEKAGFSIG